MLEVRESPFPYAEAMTHFARGLAAAHLGDVAGAQSSREALTNIHERLVKSKEGYWAEQVEIQRRTVSAWTALAEGRRDAALREMKSAAELEDDTEKSAVSPGPLATSRELLGEMLLQMNHAAEALEQFEATLKREPKRFRALYGAARAAQIKPDPEVTAGISTNSSWSARTQTSRAAKSSRHQRSASSAITPKRARPLVSRLFNRGQSSIMRSQGICSPRSLLVLVIIVIVVAHRAQEMREGPLSHVAPLLPRLHVRKAKVNSLVDACVDHIGCGI